MTILLQSNLPNLMHRGKVRDTYDLGDGRLLMVATDRLSAFDVVLPDGIPDKGAVLTQLSAFWFEKTRDVVPNHFIRLADGSPADGLAFPLPPEFIGRSMIVRKAHRLDAECVVRGYIAGSAWANYEKSGRAFGRPTSTSPVAPSQASTNSSSAIGSPRRVGTGSRPRPAYPLTSSRRLRSATARPTAA